MRSNRSARASILLTLLAALAVYLVGNQRVALWDRDEPRYAQTSRQLLQSGDWVVPRFMDDIRTAKPIFIYWCQAAAMKWFGDTRFAARLPSVIAMLATLVVVGVVVYKNIGPVRAAWTLAILASSALPIAAAKLCLTDSVLLFFVTVAQLCLAGIYLMRERVPRWVPIVMWIAIGFAGLTKGPIVLGVLLTTMLILFFLDGKNHGGWLAKIRWWRFTQPLIGVVIILIICGPWLLMISRRAPSFLHDTIQTDLVHRITSGSEGHTAPPGYYLLTVWGTFLPWSLFLPATFFFAWRRRTVPHVRFALAAIIGPWLMLETVKTKLPFYLLPIFPPLAFLCAEMLIHAQRKANLALHRRARSEAPFASRAFLALVILLGVVLTFACVIPWFAFYKFPTISRAAIAPLVLLPVISAIIYFRTTTHFRAANPFGAGAALACGSFAIVGIIYGWLLPNCAFLQTSDRIADILKWHNATHPGDEMMIDYKEPSLVFAQGGTIREQRNARYLDVTSNSQWPTWIVLTREIYTSLSDATRDHLETIGEVRGFNYADHGRDETVLVLRKK